MTPYEGGQFYFSNRFGFVFTSIVQFKYHNGIDYEGRGFPPDLFVPYPMAARSMGKDVQLEAAMTFLNAN